VTRASVDAVTSNSDIRYRVDPRRSNERSNERDDRSPAHSINQSIKSFNHGVERAGAGDGDRGTRTRVRASGGDDRNLWRDDGTERDGGANAEGMDDDFDDDDDDAGRRVVGGTRRGGIRRGRVVRDGTRGERRGGWRIGTWIDRCEGVERREWEVRARRVRSGTVVRRRRRAGRAKRDGVRAGQGDGDGEGRGGGGGGFRA